MDDGSLIAAAIESSGMDEDASFLRLLPKDFRLLAGEEIVSVTLPSIRHFDTNPSSLEQIMRLTKANRADEIGKFGPPLAALAMEAKVAEEGEPPEHLRLYEAVFGRDSLRVSIDLIRHYPELARATILELARHQGLEDNRSREEEPGRILHELRNENDPIAQKITEQLGWDWPYYGSVDATPEFIRVLVAYCQRSEENRAFLSQEYVDRLGNLRTISYALEMSLAWINRRINCNSECLLEYCSILPNGIKNQVWKDSPDSYHHADGTIANHSRGIASVEVQVTAYDALIDAAEIFEDVFDQPVRARELRLQAERIKLAIFTHFWTEEKGGYFVLGTDRDERGQLRQLKVRTSNMGHTLNSRLLKGDEPHIVRMREAVMAQIMSPELLNGSGVRTLASDEVRFRPGAYHNGSVWLWDTHHIAKGMRRLGYTQQANNLDGRILNAVNVTKMFPEYVRGDFEPVPTINHHIINVRDKVNGWVTNVEQPPQEVQAWTVAAILATRRRMSESESVLMRSIKKQLDYTGLSSWLKPLEPIIKRANSKGLFKTSLIKRPLSGKINKFIFKR